jgi:signal transduction histidine kinase
MIMKIPFGIRLWLLILAIVLVTGAVIWGLSSVEQRVRGLEAKLTDTQLESFQLAREVNRGLQGLNNSLLHYALTRDQGQWARFEQASGDLDRWIDEHDSNLNPHSLLTTEKEREQFKQINRAYDDYLSAARGVHGNAQPALTSPEQLAELDAFNAQATRMHELVRGLADAHRAAQKDFLRSTTASLDALRKILAVSFVLLLVLVGALGAVIYRDLIAPLRTRLVRSQNLLERQEKLATLGTLAAGIAHEIRNPLTSLKARLYTLEKHLQEVPAARKDTDIINAEISRLERIVREVLNFARPAPPKLERLAAEEVLREVQGLMGPTLEGRGVKLAVDCAPGLTLQADSGHLKQVLINLVRNGAEAIDGGGTVTVQARATRATLGGTETDAVVLEVSDTGKGIPAEAEKRMFDPFFSTKESGTGLGLAIAARIVEQHGGALQYRTRRGQGTTFGVVLPREKGQSVTRAKRGEDSAD